MDFMEKTSDFLEAMGCPIDGDDPRFWNEVFGSDNEPAEPHRYSTVKVAGSGPHRSWADFLARTSEADRMRWCAEMAKRANRRRLMSGRPELRISAGDVLGVLTRAEGRCCYCGSLAVERRPSDPKTGAPRPWEHVGRRIGSLEHLKARIEGGGNGIANVAWACLWCNTWPHERRPGARDHDGYYPPPAKRPRSQRAKPSPATGTALSSRPRSERRTRARTTKPGRTRK
jgi:hypothetical protein